MLVIREPISRTMRFVLGVLSVVVLIGLYTLLAHHRQQLKRDAAREDLIEVEAKLAEARAATGESNAEIVALERAAKDLERESREAIDRTVPTWKSLYELGVRRVIEPQGIGKEYWLWEDATATFDRLARGMLVGVLLSVVLGVLMGAYPSIEAFFLPPLSFLAKIPPTAMLAVFFLIGTSMKMYVTMLAFGILPTLAQTVYQAAKKDVPESLVFKALTLGASSAELIWNVIYKQILPRVIDAVRLQIGPAMVLLVAAEWMVAGEGIGYRLRLFFQRTDMTVVYVYLILLGVVGLAADYLLIALRRWICPWFGE